MSHCAFCGLDPSLPQQDSAWRHEVVNETRHVWTAEAHGFEYGARAEECAGPLFTSFVRVKGTTFGGVESAARTLSGALWNAAHTARRWHQKELERAREARRRAEAEEAADVRNTMLFGSGYDFT